MKQLKKKTTFDFRALELALRLGYTIAIPIVVLGLAGRLMDKHFGTSPLFLLCGIVLSCAITTVSLIKTVSPILERMARGTDTDTDSKKQSK